MDDRPSARTAEMSSTSPTAALSADEQLLMGVVLSDPCAGDPGTALHPLHHEMIQRGFAGPAVNLLIHRLTSLGFIEYRDVVIRSYVNNDSSYPAYRVTRLGFEVSASYSAILNFRTRYAYVLRVRGTESDNKDLLESIKALTGVERQTRFIDEEEAGVSRVAVWSYTSIDEAIKAIASDKSTVIVSLEDQPSR